MGVISLSSSHFTSLSFKIPQNTLYANGARVIPLYDKGSRGSEKEHFGIGVIIPLFHILGTLPVLIHKLNNLYNTYITI
jgi:hypothetical protein